MQAKAAGTSFWETISVLTDEKTPQAKNLTPRAEASLRNFKTVIEKLQAKTGEAASTDKPVSEVVIAAIEDTSYANALRTENSDESLARLENLEELVNAAADYDKEEGSIRDFIDHAALASDTDKYDHSAEVTMIPYIRPRASNFRLSLSSA